MRGSAVILNIMVSVMLSYADHHIIMTTVDAVNDTSQHHTWCPITTLCSCWCLITWRHAAARMLRFCHSTGCNGQFSNNEDSLWSVCETICVSGVKQMTNKSRLSSVCRTDVWKQKEEISHSRLH